MDSRWLLVAPLALALFQASSFGKGWIETDRYPIEVAPAVEALRTPTLQWVNTPVGDNPYEQIAIAKQLKLAYGFRAWHWNGRALPAAVRMLAHQDQLPDLIKQASLGIVNLYTAPPGVEYATLTRPDGAQKPCAASGIDGMIDVVCDSSSDGELLVAENSWDGWRAWIDGRPAPIKLALQLAVDLPAGRHTISFRYMPWDVPLGLGLCLLGLALAIYHWRRGDPTPVIAGN